MGKKFLSISVIETLAFGSCRNLHTHWQLLVFPTSKTKPCATRKKHVSSSRSFSAFYFPLCGDKIHFLTSPVKKIMCIMRKKFILLVPLLSSFCPGIKIHTCEIILFSLVAKCTNFKLWSLKIIDFSAPRLMMKHRYSAVYRECEL